MAYNGVYNGFAGEYKTGDNASVSPVLKWARFELGAKDIINGLASGFTNMFTVDISSITTATSIFFRIILIGDDGLLVDGLSISNYSVNSGITDLTYPAFDIQPNGVGSVIIRQCLYFGGVYDGYTSYFHTDSTNWDGTTSNRGFLDAFYTEE
jgi:hypothetical protein